MGVGGGWEVEGWGMGGGGVGVTFEGGRGVVVDTKHVEVAQRGIAL